jgi:hypothetical protein
VVVIEEMKEEKEQQKREVVKPEEEEVSFKASDVVSTNVDGEEWCVVATSGAQAPYKSPTWAQLAEGVRSQQAMEKKIDRLEPFASERS